MSHNTDAEVIRRQLKDEAWAIYHELLKQGKPSTIKDALDEQAMDMGYENYADFLKLVDGSVR